MAPTNAELVFWLVALICTAGLLFATLCVNPTENSIDDLSSWNRNYERLQRRR